MGITLIDVSNDHCPVSRATYIIHTAFYKHIGQARAASARSNLSLGTVRWSTDSTQALARSLTHSPILSDSPALQGGPMFVIRYETPLSSARDHHCIRKDVDEINRPPGRAGGRAGAVTPLQVTPGESSRTGYNSSQYRSKLAPIKRDIIVNAIKMRLKRPAPPPRPRCTLAGVVRPKPLRSHKYSAHLDLTPPQ